MIERGLLIAIAIVGLALAFIMPPPPYFAGHRRPAGHNDREQRRYLKSLRRGESKFDLAQDAWETAQWSRWNLYIRTACVVSHRA